MSLLSKILDENDFASKIDLDFFCIWIPVEKLIFQGPLINLPDSIPWKKIHDPVILNWKFRTCISISPFIICFEDDENFSSRRMIVEYLNLNGPSVLYEAANDGVVVLKKHSIPTLLLLDALKYASISYLRISNYGAKGKLKYLLEFPNLYEILLNGHQYSSCTKAVEANVVFDFAISIPDENIILFKKPLCVEKDKMWPMANWLGEGFGGFLFNYNDNSDLIVKVYSLLHHHLNASSKMEWNLPKLNRSLTAKKSSLLSIIEHLNFSGN